MPQQTGMGSSGARRASDLRGRRSLQGSRRVVADLIGFASRHIQALGSATTSSSRDQAAPVAPDI